MVSQLRSEISTSQTKTRGLLLHHLILKLLISFSKHRPNISLQHYRYKNLFSKFKFVLGCFIDNFSVFQQLKMFTES
jgi:hypothetical protein